MNPLILPLAIVVLASVFQGTFGLGMKYIKPLPWEAWWLVHSCVAMLILPLVWALLAVPHLGAVLAAAPAEVVTKAMLYGFLWGIGGILFGVSVGYIGMSLTYGIVMGLAAAGGSLIPLAQLDNAGSNPATKYVLAGVAVMLVGVAICGAAGIRRDRAMAGDRSAAAGKSLRTGLGIAVACGLLSALLNVGFANAAPIAQAAEQAGALPRNSSLAAWVVVLWGAVLMNAGYALLLLVKNRSWSGFRVAGGGKAYKWAVIAGFLWFGALGTYGQGAALMGRIGPVIGWPILLGLSLIVSNALGVFTGEWAGAGPAFRMMVRGLIVLLVACGILGFANSVHGAESGQLPGARVNFLNQGFGGQAGRSTLGRTVMTLDGTWRIRYGEEEAAWQEIPVPSCWEQFKQDYEGVAWYEKTFSVPADWKGRELRLRFGAVNYIAQVWVNGAIAGYHEGGYTPFDLEVSGLVKAGENTVRLRVTGPAILKDKVDTLIRDESPHWRGAYVGGVWQSVSLIATDPVFTGDIFVEPRVAERSALAHVRLENTGARPVAITATAVVETASGPAAVVTQTRASLTVQPGGTAWDPLLPMAGARLWSPADPALYRVRVTLAADGQEIDTDSARFGLREFTVKEGRFELNGRPLFIKGGFWEGLYPRTESRPDLEMVRREITLAKEAGFNLLRPWRMPPDPRILDLADELGVLVVGSPPIECMGFWPTETPQLERRWTEEMTRMVRRDRNHPAIVMWETANEIDRRSVLLMRHRVSLAARECDPSRLIVDESGGARAPWGSHVYLPGQTVPVETYDRHIYVRAPLDSADRQRLNETGDPAKLTFISEVGYGGFPDLPDDVARYDRAGGGVTPDVRYHQRLLSSLEEVMKDHQLYELFPNATALCLADQDLQASGDKLQVEALRTNPTMRGYCLHAFTDGDWVLGAGVLDLWRQPKRVWAALRDVNRPLYLAIGASPSSNVYAARGATLTVTAVNEGEPAEGTLECTVTNAQGRQLWSVERAVQVGAGLTPLLSDHPRMESWEGAQTVRARLRRGGQILAENTFDLWVVAPRRLETPAGPVTTLEFGGEIQPSPGAARIRPGALHAFLASRGVREEPFTAGKPVAGPVLVAASDAQGEAETARFAGLIDYVRAGGTAIFLVPPAQRQADAVTRYDESGMYVYRIQGGNPRRNAALGNRLVERGVFPLELHKRKSVGHWISVGHYARPGPLFDGLPTGGFMGQPYQNVAARETLVGFPGRAVAGCVSWDLMDKNYLGPNRMWHGTDVAVVPMGKGRAVLSMLDLLGHLGSDPVADELLFNLLRFADNPKD